MTQASLEPYMSSRKRMLANLFFSACLLIMISLRSATGEAQASAPKVSVPMHPVSFKLDQVKHRGISWVGSGPVSREHLTPISEVGSNWIVQTPFGWQRYHNSPNLRLSTSAHLWGETDEGLIVTARHAHQQQLKILLKPHIWLTRSPDGKWRSDIAMKDEKAWALWWKNYHKFMLHYARLAEEQGMAALCVGTELAATVHLEKEWRNLIAEVRKVYSGKLTYAANWYDEYERVPFWDALDWIGIQAYFPLAQNPDASVEELVQGWQPHLQQIAKIANQFQRPVLFTEVGYRATPDAAIEPWLWPKRGQIATDQGLAVQETCYEAFFKAVWPQPWLLGAYIWKWHPHLQLQKPSNPSIGFTPQHKPAMDVLKRYYLDQP